MIKLAIMTKVRLESLRRISSIHIQRYTVSAYNRRPSSFPSTCILLSLHISKSTHTAALR